jgi:hypothetical protein
MIFLDQTNFYQTSKREPASWKMVVMLLYNRKFEYPQYYGEIKRVEVTDQFRSEFTGQASSMLASVATL